MHEADRKEELKARLSRSLTNQPPSPVQIHRIELLRGVGKDLGNAIVELCPLSREQSLALTHLEDAIMWAVKSIVLEQEGDK